MEEEIREAAKYHIRLLDSGAGGLNTILFAEENRGRDRRDYLAVLDTGFFPYGEKNPRELRERLEFLIDKFDINILACNTAGTLISNIKSPVRYVEQVMRSKENWVLLCTQLASLHYRDVLRKLNKGGCDVRSHSPVKFEAGKKPALNFKKFGCVILGCTHFKDYKLKSVEVVDSARLLAEHLPPPRKIEIVLTGTLTRAISEKVQSLVNKGLEVKIRKEVI